MKITDSVVRLPSGRRTKFAVLAVWLVLAALAAPFAAKLTDVQDNTALSALPASAEAAVAQQRAEAAFPESDASAAVAVYARDSATLTDADRARVERDRAEFARYAEGGTVPPAMSSSDGQAMLLSFRLAGDADQRASAVDAVKQRLASDTTGGLRAALTGPAAADDDIGDAFDGVDVTLLLATVGAVALLLLVTYRSPVLWLVPLVTVAVASQLASAAVYLLARHAGLAVDLQSQNILTVLVFGVGVDYALLLVARYREELRRHADRHVAMAVALRRCLPAVCASAATVVIGLLCLLAAVLPSTHGLGPVAAVGVAAVLVAMTTLLPAVLVLLGRWVFWPFVPRHTPGATARDVADDHGLWRRVAGAVGRRPRTVWIGTALALAALTAGVGRLSIGMPSDEAFTNEVGSVTGQHLVADHYPDGTVSPAQILATADTADRVVAAARAVDGVADVGRPERSGEWVRVDAVLADPPDSAAAKDTVERLREAVHAVPDARALVGGDTAVALDTDRVIDRDNRVVIPMILGVVFLVLALQLRALVAPLLLLGGVVLSYLAAMGVAGLVLDAMGYPRLWNALPLQVFLFLVALGVDYTIFLMSRAREEVARLGHRRGVLHALTVTGGVITSAGLVLAATFAALTVLPLVPSVQTGVIVAAGVLLDTFVVRSLLVPALTLHIGRLAWWPGRLSRRVAPAPPRRAGPPTPTEPARVG